MDYRIYPGKLAGTVQAPSSKSAAHRALICACLADGNSILGNLGSNQDVLASISVAKALGAMCQTNDNHLLVQGIVEPQNPVHLHCNESGSTLRFFAPIAGALGIQASFYGKGRLPERPMEPLLTILQEHGIAVHKMDNEIFTSSGKLQPGVFTLPGDISSQYVSGLLFALPLLDGDSEIQIIGSLESALYVDMTIQMLSQFGVCVEKHGNTYQIPGKQIYRPAEITIEGDYSGAAFWLAASALGQEILIDGLSPTSLQPDRKIIAILREFGTNITTAHNCIKSSVQELHGVEIDASQIPDSVPILAVVGALSSGTTRIYNAKRLIHKESNRLESTCYALRALGGDICITDDGITITGGRLIGGEIDSCQDHRIAMAMTVAALHADAPVIISGAECVQKSYPEFFQDFTKLGGAYDVV